MKTATHIEIGYNKNKTHLSDLMKSRICFATEQILIKRIEMKIRKKESLGTGVNIYDETDTMVKFEVMDSAAGKGESIPVRKFLSCSKSFTPTYWSVNNLLTVLEHENTTMLSLLRYCNQIFTTRVSFLQIN